MHNSFTDDFGSEGLFNLCGTWLWWPRKEAARHFRGHSCPRLPSMLSGALTALKVFCPQMKGNRNWTVSTQSAKQPTLCRLLAYYLRSDFANTSFEIKYEGLYFGQWSWQRSCLGFWQFICTEFIWGCF